MAIVHEDMVPIFLFFLLYNFFYLSPFNEAADTITKGQSIKDGDFLVSEDETYEMGFFSPKNSAFRYVGVRYNRLQNPAVIWVANRKTPIPDRKGVLTIGEDGNLVISDGNGNSVWSSNVSIPSSISTVALLEKTGNLILSSNDSIGDLYKAYWQSFDFPTDTYLPNMKVLVQGENHAFTSWTSPSDPSPGSFSSGIDGRGAPQIVIWNQSQRLWRSGYWDGQIFTGVPSMADATTYQYGFKVSYEDGNLFVTYNPSNPADLLRFRILYNGSEEQLKWNESVNEWIVMHTEPANDCELYNHCGNFGVCNAKKTVKCSCLKGFRPKYPDQWKNGDFSRGCERSSALQCQKNTSSPERKKDRQDGFQVMQWVKVPDFADVLDPKATPESCRDMCIRDCSCNAYAGIDGIGCMVWNGDLVDVQQFDRSGNTMYLRLPASELGGRRISTVVILSIIAAGVLFLIVIFWLLLTVRRKFKAPHPSTTVSRSRKSETWVSELSWTKEFSTDLSGPSELLIEGSSANGQDLPVFNFITVAAATKNFSAENMLGQGGFGPVYKGKLRGGQEIAVKRLSKISGQGLEEFKNEVILIARLQHRNLVRLLGCCIDGEEKLLLYEYMPNKSLDSFIFDPQKQALLDWSKRFIIIEGIARGLVYLHRDSRLRIIHRDLKASNILLDGEMNPKISDFGMARMFGGNQNVANTNRVVGTFGYMSPEYAMEGIISVKSDVYSFGVLLLEIVSGRRNTSSRSSVYKNLIAYAWEHWNEDKVMEIIDPSIRDSCVENEVLRCMKVAMLCVQDSAGHRPTMDSVVRMLETENTILPVPRQPTFTCMRSYADTETFTNGQETVSSNNMTVTVVAGR